MAEPFKYAVSVIIPVYNTESFLLRCLNSIRKQTLQNIQIICINDGSTDRCAQILADTAADDNRFIVINQENKGQAEARNRGLKEAQGKYVFFVDADDYLHTQALDVFYHVAEKTQADVVVSSIFTRIGKDKIHLTPMDPDKIPYKICTDPLKNLYAHRRISAVVWNKLYRADILKQHHFITGIRFEDWPFTACLFATLDKFTLIHENLYVYDNTTPSTVRSAFSVKKVQDYMTGIRYVRHFMMDKGLLNEWKIIRKKRIATSLKMVLSKISKSSDNTNALEKCFKEEYLRLIKEGAFSFWDLSLKSKFRLLRLFWHQKNADKKISA